MEVKKRTFLLKKVIDYILSINSSRYSFLENYTHTVLQIPAIGIRWQLNFMKLRKAMVASKI